ncbi:hypothetical protein CC85DRAFT_286131 [Cutaneotrichosporon oleaginosum]|uniref:Uncharacterized protein n=1 Tax=Cutaneotrichosporon oleaginosum TaxID=879819 RepID=A0A0J1B284_9TREE|nr:uncharacterized protein CC85DRAFT_286131 [Cutaneotrichosporon oleaginosum]KLT41729.1 hypothetical protein CC85DRAFT_286131 [Cutaneotrichosporon oleaginosum]TXT12327.1 hypothetical protein COLE_02737 [Cutaneotrichosporon oleaginosum]
MSASRLQRRACAPEPRGRGRSAVPKRTLSSVAFSCPSLDACLHACGSTSFPSSSSSSSSSSSPSPPTSPEEEHELELPPPAGPETKAEHEHEHEPEPAVAPEERRGRRRERDAHPSPATRAHTTAYPPREVVQNKDPRLARIAEPSTCTPRPRPLRRSTGARSPLATTSTLPCDLDVP